MLSISYERDARHTRSSLHSSLQHLFSRCSLATVIVKLFDRRRRLRPGSRPVGVEDRRDVLERMSGVASDFGNCAPRFGKTPNSRAAQVIEGHVLDGGGAPRLIPARTEPVGRPRLAP